MIEFFPYPFLAGCALLVLAGVFNWRRSHNRARLVFLALLGFYLLLAIRETLFPIYLGDGWRQPLLAIFSRINLRPFYFGGLFGLYPHIARLEIFGNLLLTVPLGFLLPLVVRIRPRRLPWLLLAGGLSFELGQLILNLVFGATSRSVDINDVILNASGTLIGYGLFRLLAGAVRFAARRGRAAPQGLARHLLEMGG